jgi:hypothetical protein
MKLHVLSLVNFTSSRQTTTLSQYSVLNKDDVNWWEYKASAVDKWMNEWARGNGGMVMADKYRSSPRKICLVATSSTTNPTRAVLGSKLRIPAHNLIVWSHLDYLDVHYQILPVPVAARSKAWVCGRSLAGIVGSNSAGMDAYAFECCVLSGEDLCVGLNRSSRGVLPSVVCLIVVVKPWQWGGPGLLGDVVP